MINPRRFQRPNDHFFHLCSGLASESWQELHYSQKWNSIKYALMKTQATHQFTIHCIVLMGTHLHILFATNEVGENIIVEDFHRLLKLQLLSSDDVLETPLFCEPINNYKQFLNTYKYIYRNPVEAGLCQRVEDYSFSTLRELLGLEQKSENKVVVDPLGLPQQPFRMLDWLNQPNKEIWGQW